MWNGVQRRNIYNHLLHVIVDEIGLDKVKSMVVNPIDFRVASYYSPNMQQDGFVAKMMFMIQNMEMLMKTLGGKNVDWNPECKAWCASILTEDTVLKLSTSVLNDAKSEAQLVSVLATSHSVMDIYQVRHPKEQVST